MQAYWYCSSKATENIIKDSMPMFKNIPLRSYSILILCFLWLETSIAQEFDNTRFLPIQVGNEWQYRVVDGDNNLTGYERFKATRDTVINDLGYIIIDRSSFNTDIVRTSTASCAIRINIEGERLTVEKENLKGECQHSFCFPDPSVSVFIPSTDREIEVSGQSYAVEATASFGSGSCGPGGQGCLGHNNIFASDIGPYDCERYYGLGFPLVEHSQLSYAQIEGNIYGAQVVSNSRDNLSSDYEFSISGMYPNPASHQLRVEFALLESTSVTIEVYDLLGRIVKQINKGILLPGEHSQIIDTSYFAEGTYFIALEREEHRETIPVTVLH